MNEASRLKDSELEKLDRGDLTHKQERRVAMRRVRRAAFRVFAQGEGKSRSRVKSVKRTKDWRRFYVLVERAGVQSVHWLEINDALTSVRVVEGSAKAAKAARR